MKGKAQEGARVLNGKRIRLNFMCWIQSLLCWS